jgi:hypothetical protein
MHAGGGGLDGSTLHIFTVRDSLAASKGERAFIATETQFVVGRLTRPGRRQRVAGDGGIARVLERVQVLFRLLEVGVDIVIADVEVRVGNSIEVRAISVLIEIEPLSGVELVGPSVSIAIADPERIRIGVCTIGVYSTIRVAVTTVGTPGGIRLVKGAVDITVAILEVGTGLVVNAAAGGMSRDARKGGTESSTVVVGIKVPALTETSVERVNVV